MTPEHAQLAIENASAEQIRTKAFELGLVSLKDSAIQKVIDGVTTVEEVLAIAAESG